MRRTKEVLVTPPTYQRGQFTIDGLFIPNSISTFHMGYIPFGQGVSGADHHCSWIDLTISEVFSNHLPPLHKPGGHRLKLEDPRVVDKFISTLDHMCKQVSFQEEVRNLDKSRGTPSDIQKYETLDKFLTNAFLSSERTCWNFKRGGIPWSPDLSIIWNKILYWHLVLKKKTYAAWVGTRYLEKIIQKGNWERHNAVSITYIKIRLSNTYVEFK